VLEAALGSELSGAGLPLPLVACPGVVTGRGEELDPFFEAFADAMAEHRHFTRGISDKGAETASRPPSDEGTP
jgi:hypothetical protein